MDSVIDGIVAPASPATPKPVRERLAALTESFLTRPVGPLRRSSMRGKAVSGLRALGAAAVVAGVGAGCANREPDGGYGYELAERPMPSLPAQVESGERLRSRYERWDELESRPGALFMRDAAGGDGYEINWYTDDLNAPIPIAPQVMYGIAPDGTKFNVDQYGNQYPANPTVRSALTATSFVVESVPLVRPEETICVSVTYNLADGRTGSAGDFLVDTAAPDGFRVQSTDRDAKCPSGPSTAVVVPVQVIGPGR